MGGREGVGGKEGGEMTEGGEMKKGVGEEGRDREKQLLASQKMGELLRNGGLGERGSEREARK